VLRYAQLPINNDTTGNREFATVEEFLIAALACLEHHWNNHEFCNSEWCPWKAKAEAKANAEAKAKAKAMNDSDDDDTDSDSDDDDDAIEADWSSSSAKYRDKKKDPLLYAEMLEIHSKYTTPTRLHEVHHTWSTQKNEAMNQSIAKYAPKGRDYSTTGSLYRRVLAAVGVNSGGMHYFSKVLEKIGCCVPPSRQLRFFDTRDHQNQYDYSYKQRPCNKRKRNEKNTEAMAVQAKEDKAGPQYKTGLALEIMFDSEDRAPRTNAATTAASKAATTATSKAPCVRCGGTDHKRSNSKKCRFFKGRKLPSGEWLCFSCLSCSVF
jgi:hypothetical protein